MVRTSIECYSIRAVVGKAVGYNSSNQQNELQSNDVGAKTLITHGHPSSTSGLSKLKVRAKEPHIYTATMASGYGLAGGTYTSLSLRIEERLWRRRRTRSGRNGRTNADDEI
jgi:hypothetical protein